MSDLVCEMLKFMTAKFKKKKKNTEQGFFGRDLCNNVILADSTNV